MEKPPQVFMARKNFIVGSLSSRIDIRRKNDEIEAEIAQVIDELLSARRIRYICRPNICSALRLFTLELFFVILFMLLCARV
jgi:hypothetical protein